MIEDDTKQRLMTLRRPSSSLVRLAGLGLALFFALCGSGQAQLKPPSLISFSPTQAAPGSTVTITFSGTNFVPRAMNLVFSPSQGITVSKLQVLSPMQISAQLQIDPSAQPGSRQVILTDADHSLRSPTPFTITAAARIVLRESPPRLAVPDRPGRPAGPSFADSLLYRERKGLR